MKTFLDCLFLVNALHVAFIYSQLYGYWLVQHCMHHPGNLLSTCQPLEKKGIEIRGRFLFLFSYFQIIRFYIGFAQKIQRKDFRILKSIFES